MRIHPPAHTQHVHLLAPPCDWTLCPLNLAPTQQSLSPPPPSLSLILTGDVATAAEAGIVAACHHDNQMTAVPILSLSKCSADSALHFRHTLFVHTSITGNENISQRIKVVIVTMVDLEVSIA